MMAAGNDLMAKSGGTERYHDDDDHLSLSLPATGQQDMRENEERRADGCKQRRGRRSRSETLLRKSLLKHMHKQRRNYR